jgi:hypothetical protein
MENRINISKSSPEKMPGFFRRAFKRVATASEPSLVDDEMRRIARRHQAISLFAPTFKTWNR